MGTSCPAGHGDEEEGLAFFGGICLLCLCVRVWWGT